MNHQAIETRRASSRHSIPFHLLLYPASHCGHSLLMAPSKTVGSSGTNPPSSARRSTPTQRTSNTMDSSRHGADDMSPEPATAAMIDVSSWAQRGLVLENKDLRRTLEMTKSAHTAQLAQIAKRHKTEKEELEVKLEAETYRLAAQQRTLDELAVRLERVQGDNGKLTESVQSLDKGLIAKTEENSRLQRELEDSKSKLESTGEELKAIKAKQEELLGRESRVAAVLNDQHHKIMNLSQAYHEQEGDKVQLQSMLETAEKEVTRLRSRLSGILDTLVKVVHDNGDVMDDVDLPGENVEMKDASMRESNKKPEGRKRTRATDQQASREYFALHLAYRRSSADILASSALIR
jgi:DNA repair exonuclease SbcCD ATPase subunit